MQQARFMFVMLAFSLSLLLFSVSSGAINETRDPFVAAPLGPFALVSNPASALNTTHLTLQLAAGMGEEGSGLTEMLAYFEPDTGLGAGALHWLRTETGGTTRRELGYTLARLIGDHLAYGITIKHIRQGNDEQWAVDLGLVTHGPKRVRAGLVVHNLIGESQLNPTHVTGSLAYQVTQKIGIMASLAAPTLTDTSLMEAGLGIDLPFILGSSLRLGRSMNLSTGEGYWLGSLQSDFQSLSISATMMRDDAAHQRIGIGVVYRF